LEKDAKRVFQRVLKLDKDHEGAHLALGDEKVEGTWMPAKQAAKLREKALEAEYSAKGYKKIDDIWVEPDKVDDARKGIFYHEGEKVTRDQKVAYQNGKVRHPVTGQFIAAEDLQKAEGGYFPLADGKWGDKAEADKFHSELSHPWIVRSTYATLISTLPLDKIQELKLHADQGQETVMPLFGSRKLPPALRPVIIIAKSRNEFVQYGTGLGDGTDVVGAFLVRDDAEFRLVGQGVVRPAICNNDKDWGTRFLRHAAAIAYVNAAAAEAGADLPLWFVHGAGSLTSRFENDRDAGWFGKQHMAKGGVGNIKSWLDSFDLSPDIEQKDVDYNLFQAGLMLAYGMRGGDQEATDALMAVTDALSDKGKGSAGKALSKFEKLLDAKKPQIVEYLNKLIAKAP
ncbi:MAG: hypothetical protein KAI24_09005, partial [Planctomycetes bacterium]|nr:hypothetical protein [Planctomycetota bacterium]